MFDKYLVPVYLPRWLWKLVLGIKRIFVPPVPPAPPNILGERNIEWSFLSAHMPDGPGRAVEFGCEQGYMSLVAAQKGYEVVANDLQRQSFFWEHPKMKFLEGDFLKLELPSNHFDIAINCSSVEHVGVAGRYGIEINDDRGDIEVMKRLAEVLKPGGLLLMTAPVGIDSILAPWCRVYGAKRLPELVAPFEKVNSEYWVKSEANQWIAATESEALQYQPIHDTIDSHRCSYALGCFVLRKPTNQTR